MSSGPIIANGARAIEHVDHLVAGVTKACTAHGRPSAETTASTCTNPHRVDATGPVSLVPL